MNDLSLVLSQASNKRNLTIKTKTERIFLIAQKEQLTVEGVRAQAPPILGGERLTESLDIKLKYKGYQIEVFHNEILAEIAIHQREPDLVILDETACSFKNFNVYYRLRSTNKYIPVIALTREQSAARRIEILNAGADYCLSKPFSIQEFLAIIQACLRQNKKEKSSTLMFEDLQLNTLSRQVYRHNRHIILTAKEFNLLKYLMQHPLQVLTRAQIIETIWGVDFTGDSNIIEVYIRYLRIKLEAKQEKRLIHTVRSVGYVLRSQ